MIDHEKISSLYDLHARELMAFIYGMVESREAAEDLLHDTFVRLIEHAHSNSIGEQNLRALLFTIARNLVIDRARHLRRVTIKSLETVTEPNVSDDQDERLAYEEMRSAVEKSLKKMDTRYSEVFVLKRETGMTYSEIGKILDLSERTVKRRMKNALLILTGDLTSAGFFALLSILMAFAAGLYVILIKGKP